MRRGPRNLVGVVAFMAGVAAFAVGGGGVRSAAAQSRPPSDGIAASTEPPKTREQLEAQQHFQKAKELYSAGSYREAIAELEAARNLDPKAKDLVFNLGIVHERLAQYDEAIAFFRSYIEMDNVTTAERGKAETIIKRIEGAKRESPLPPTSTSPGPTPETPGPAATTTPAPRGRIDTATIVAGSVAAVGLAVGATFGILALANQPGDDGFVTGRDGSYADLESKANDAHTQAVVADIGLGVGLVAAAVTAYLYFSRTRDPQATAAPRAGSLRFGATPLTSSGAEGNRPGGAAILLGGSFR